MIIASIITLTILILLAIFQIVLIMGAPLGNYAWGGQYKVLPTKLRIGSIISIIIYAVFAAFVLSKSGVWVLISNETVVSIGLWVMTIYAIFGIFLNAISRSKPERNLMTSTAAILAAMLLIMALS